MPDTVNEVVAVFRNEHDAEEAARDVRSVLGRGPRIGGRDAEVESLKSEMREELEHTIAGPGNIGPFTKEMTKGIVVGVTLGVIVGFVVTVPLGLVPFPTVGLGLRLVIAGFVGAFAGATVGFVDGGGFAAKGPLEPLAAERGTPVVIDVRTPDEVRRATDAFRRHGAIRVDLTTADGTPVTTLTTEEEELRHLRRES
jgi:F0F1-type ATP synthase assembly protein I